MSSPPVPPHHLLAAGLAGLLVLPRFAILELFALPGDPLPQAITRLTHLTKADVQRLTALTTAEALEAALHTTPTELYFFVLISCLCYDTPLGRAALVRIGGADIWEESVESVRPLSIQLLPLLARYLPDPAAVAAPEAEVRAVFAQAQHGLPHTLPPPTAPTPDDDNTIWQTMRPTAQEQNLFSWALNMTVMARMGVPHPLGHALNTVPALGSDEQLNHLARRMKAVAPEVTQELNGPDLLRLYLSLNVLALLCVADLQPALMDRLQPNPAAPAPWLDPARQQGVVQWVSTQVEALNQLFDENHGDRPAYQAAQAEVQRLAELM